jgi:hypothetical protein
MLLDRNDSYIALVMTTRLYCSLSIHTTPAIITRDFFDRSIIAADGRLPFVCSAGASVRLFSERCVNTTDISNQQQPAGSNVAARVALFFFCAKLSIHKK